MRKALSNCLALCMVAAAAISLAPTTVQAATSCLVAPAPLGTSDGWIGTNPTEVHVPGGGTLGVSGEKIRICGESYGDSDPTHATQRVSLRVVPGACEATAVYDHTCLTVWLESNGLPGYTSWTIEHQNSAGLGGSTTIELPPLPRGSSTCLISMGYRAAPTRPCTIVWDMGQ